MECRRRVSYQPAGELTIDRQLQRVGAELLHRETKTTCASLLADLDVHPRVAMQILRHAQFAITMEIYTVVSSAATRDALKRLGSALDR